MIPITRDELNLWSRYIHDICGVHIDETRGYLLETRLSTLFREIGAGSFSELYSRVKADLSLALRRKVIDAITTNETSFFRDNAPFELIRHKLIPELIDRRMKTGLKPTPIRIWSAACSTGQEAYSTGIILRELLGDCRNYDIRILGTDISDQAVAKASYGYFSQMEIERGLPPDRASRYFTREGDRYKIRDEIRGMMTFRNMNLLESFAFPTPFDIIFCRNVAIYFTESDKIRLFKNIGRCMAKDGALIIGSTESITGLCPEFEVKRYLRTVFYNKRS